jgi:dTDP-4-dehydrorhamnose 3,5-epimerase
MIMICKETKLKRAFVIEPEKRTDERGFFARVWCRREFEAHGLATNIVQSNVSVSKKAGTLRGMHYQKAPFEEAKLIRCTKGAIYDVIIDLRPTSSTYTQWIAEELTEHNYRMLYVPEGFAHGFQSLTDDVEVFYHVSQFYSPEAERGIRWNDPQFGIQWPEIGTRIISDKDRNWPDYRE